MRLHIKPIRTHFQGDSLFMSQAKPNTMQMTFQLHIEKDVATFTGLIDFDGDGKTDDLYYGRQRKHR